MSMFTRDQLYNKGHVRTKALFVEFGDTPETILSLTSSDKGYPCLKNLYVSLCTDDPSEVTFVDAVFGDFQFWERLKKSPFMKEELPKWEHEATVRRKSKAFASIVGRLDENTPTGYQAAKFLIDEPWKKSPADKKRKQDTTRKAHEATVDVPSLQEYLNSKGS